MSTTYPLTRLTIADIHRMRPCNMAPGEQYSRDNLRKLFGGDSIALPDLLRLETVPVKDRIWVALRESVLGRVLYCTALADIAEHVLPIFESKYPADASPRQAIATVRAYGRGEIGRDELLKASYAAAADRASAAADRASAVASAAAYAAYAAAYAAYASAYAAYASAAAASHASASAAERQWQLARIIELLEGP